MKQGNTPQEGSLKLGTEVVEQCARGAEPAGPDSDA